LAYSATDECLFDSLVLGEFLAAYDIHPTLVLGISTNPFEAHAWLQDAHIVVGDRPTRVKRFTPILAV
jgi:hypothetical protein